MNYQKQYDNIVRRCKHRKLITERGFEIHHIIPRSVNGSDKNTNLVKLTYREHFVCHLLLTKIYPTSKALIYSAWKFTYSKDGHVKVNNSHIHKMLKDQYLDSVLIYLDKKEMIKYFSNPHNTIWSATKYFGRNWTTIYKNLGYYDITYLWDGNYNKQYTKTEIIDIMNSNQFETIQELAINNNILYGELNKFINIYHLEYLRPKRFVKNEKQLIDYIKSGERTIHRHKLFKEFHMHAQRVTAILKKYNLNYISYDEENMIKYNYDIDTFLIELFNNIPPHFSKAGFNKHFREHPTVIAKKITALNINYSFGYNHHKGNIYNEQVKPIIEQGIRSGILKK